MATTEFTPQELENEQWRDAVGYEGYFQVSNLGHVRRITGTNRWGDHPLNPPRKLTGAPNQDGYIQVHLSVHRNRGMRSIHILVAKAFIGPRPEGMEVNHKDTVKTNNRVDNLEYMTHGDNIRHAFANGIVPRLKGAEYHAKRKAHWAARGETHPRAEITVADVTEMRRRHKAGEPCAQIARDYEMDRCHVWRIATGRSWKCVPL